MSKHIVSRAALIGVIAVTIGLTGCNNGPKVEGKAPPPGTVPSGVLDQMKHMPPEQQQAIMQQMKNSPASQQINQSLKDQNGQAGTSTGH